MLTPELIRQIRQIEIRSRRLADEGFAGAYQSTFKGPGLEFAEVRPYSPGDDIRSIDWNVTARAAQPYIKRFTEEREQTVLLLVDSSASTDFGSVGRFKRELAAELAAVLAFSAVTNNDRVGLVLFDAQVEQIIPPGKGRQHVLHLIREVLAAGSQELSAHQQVHAPVGEAQNSDTGLARALTLTRRVLIRRSIVFVLSDFIAEPEGYRRELARAARRHDVIALEISDPLEQRMPPSGLVALRDPEEKRVVWADTSDPVWQAAFEKHTLAADQARKALFAQVGVDPIRIQTGQDYLPALRQFFARRSLRQQRGYR